MKKLLLIATVIFISGLTLKIQAQESVNTCILNAKRLQRSMNDRYFKNFRTSYEEALKDIAEIEAKASSSEFGNDLIADHAEEWIKLNQQLSKFENGNISYKGETIQLELKDYEPVLKEARKKASKAHFDEAIQIIQASKIFENRKKAIPHLDKAKQYDESYTTQVKNNKALIYYEEALRIYNQETDFILKEDAVPLFENALHEKNPYKDSKELLAKLYSDEADLLYDSNKFDDIKKAISYYNKSASYVYNYNGASGKILGVKQKAASLLYEQGLKKEQTLSFKAQKEAGNLYKQANMWNPGYKDVEERIKATSIKSTLNVIITDNAGGVITKNPTTNEIFSQTNDYISLPIIKTPVINLENIEDCITVAKELGFGFILMRIDTNRIAYTYKGVITDTEAKTIERFFLNKRSISTGKTSESEISKQEYTEGLKEQKATGRQSDSRFRLSYKSYTGTHSTITSKAVVEVSYPFEIWDVRDPNHMTKITDIIYSEEISDKKVKTTYSGSMKIKPELINEGSLMTQNELMEIANKQKPSIFFILNSYEDTIIKVLNQIEYKTSKLYQ
ncbi:hypothetical protein [Plebeiibacterium sediminum]|uniref:Tetratricopeptide repeat protein n=1 Tax=Plebeiibacterium sediminum TaxID=2992112 RepID=A0AAE3SE04_9BACT|nr:hypothetical protein [Plebeiobacterium sediminum]MCW3785835.1 hypothetical protein [Plebeiobacterium sediminum]